MGDATTTLTDAGPGSHQIISRSDGARRGMDRAVCDGVCETLKDRLVDRQIQCRKVSPNEGSQDLYLKPD